MNQDLTQLYRALAIFLAKATTKTFDEIPDEATLNNQDNLWYKSHCIKNPSDENCSFCILLSARYKSDKPTVKRVCLMNSKWEIVEIIA